MSADVLAAVLGGEGAAGVVLLLQILQDQADLLEAVERLLGVLDGEVGVVILLPLRTLVHRYAGTGIWGQTHTHTQLGPGRQALSTCRVTD